MIIIDKKLCTGFGKYARICYEGFGIMNDMAFITDSEATCIKKQYQRAHVMSYYCIRIIKKIFLQKKIKMKLISSP